MSPIRVFLCESQPVVAEGLARVFAECPDVELIGTAATLEGAITALETLAPDVVLISTDPGVPAELHGLPGLASATPGARLVLWSWSPESHQDFLEAGFDGLLDKRCQVSELLECVRSVAQGNRWVAGGAEAPESLRCRRPLRLTPRERDIVRLVAEGRKNREIGEALDISPGTVKVHLMHIFEKAGVEDRMQLALLARRLLAQDTEAPAPSELWAEDRAAG